VNILVGSRMSIHHLTIFTPPQSFVQFEDSR
jgi:hypothetical protein